MLNAEKYKKEILEITEEGYNFAVSKDRQNIVRCTVDFTCENCIFGEESDCCYSLAWKGRNASGHVMNVVQRNGKTYVYDGQTGKKYKLSDVLNVSRTKSTQLVRVDNLEFSNQAREAVRKK